MLVVRITHMYDNLTLRTFVGTKAPFCLTIPCNKDQWVDCFQRQLKNEMKYNKFLQSEI